MNEEVSVDNTAIYALLPFYVFGMSLIGALSWWMNNNMGELKLGPFAIAGGKVADGTQTYLGAGRGVGAIPLFFTMAASLYSGYSISGIANEAYTFGFLAVRWIPAGVALYAAFMVLAPRMHALGKARGYLTVSEIIYDRYSQPAMSPAVPHALRLLSLFCLQLPVFCYLISQFSSISIELATYTNGGHWSGPGMSRYGTMIGAGVIMLVCGLLGGLRAVAYNDVFQGAILMIGCVVFFIIEEQELGGLGGVREYVTSPEYAEINPFGFGKFNNVPNQEGGWSAASFSSFILKVMIAATMFPHLTMRLLVARDSSALQYGLAGMNFTFFIVQLSTMITGWVAVKSFGGAKLATGVFGSLASTVRATGSGGEFASALMLTAAVCAMLSTADSSLLAFSTMWLRDFYLPYINPKASAREQLIFTRCASIVGLVIGLFLTAMAIREKGSEWNLSNLFSLQTVTPIHVAPAMWLGLHWKGLRGEAVLAGMLVGLSVTFGFTFSALNVKLALGLEETKQGWSPALIGFCFNLIVTGLLGLALEKAPLPSAPPAAFSRPLDVHALFGVQRDKLLNPALWFVMCILIAFTTPFYRTFGSPDSFVGSIASWAFISLMFSGVITVTTAAAYIIFWPTYDLPVEDHPFVAADVSDVKPGDGAYVMPTLASPNAPVMMPGYPMTAMPGAPVPWQPVNPPFVTMPAINAGGAVPAITTMPVINAGGVAPQSGVA